MELAHASRLGAFGLELEGGGKEMIDAPMLKQVSVSIKIPLTDHLSIFLGPENHSDGEGGPSFYPGRFSVTWGLAAIAMRTRWVIF